MSWFRRKSLHERLALEGGLGQQLPPVSDTRPRWGEVGIHGVHRLREWDAIVVADAPGMRDEPVRFVALPDGSLLLEEGDEPGDLGPLAAAVEAEVEPPYRAEAVRKAGDRFAIGVRRIQVIELPDVEGDELMLTVTGSDRALEVDGAREFGHLRELERLGEAVAESYVVRAERLDGDLWEVQVNPL